METASHPAELVRCASCHAVYDQARGNTHEDEVSACPKCGASAWLGLRVPLPQSALRPSA